MRKIVSFKPPVRRNIIVRVDADRFGAVLFCGGGAVPRVPGMENGSMEWKTPPGERCANPFDFATWICNPSSASLFLVRLAQATCPASPNRGPRTEEKTRSARIALPRLGGQVGDPRSDRPTNQPTNHHLQQSPTIQL